jgi:hypothetical protein
LRRVAVAVALLAGLLGCAQPRPSQLTVTATPPSPSPTPVVTPGPRVVCHEVQFQPPLQPPPALTCDAAVEAALGALPADHPRIDTASFSWGHYCPRGCPIVPAASEGFVVFEFTGSDPEVWVHVRADESGDVTIQSEVAEFPPPNEGWGPRWAERYPPCRQCRV